MTERTRNRTAGSTGMRGGRALYAFRAVVTRAVSILASFLLTIVVARLLGAADSGVFFIVLTSLAVLATFARFGTDNLALKLCGGASKALLKDVLRLLAVCGLGSLVAMMVAVATLALWRSPISQLSWPVILLGASAAAAQAFSVLAGAVLRGNGMLATGTLAELGSLPALTLAIVVVEAALSSATLTGAVLALCAASWLTAAWAVPFALAVTKKAQDAQGAEDRRLGAFLSENFRRMGAMMGTSLLFYVLTWAPQYILAATSDTSDVAFYTTAARLAAFITLVPSIQVSYLAPAFARLYHHRQVAALNDLCNRSTWQAAFAALLPALVFIVTARPVVQVLYGKEFAGAAFPLAILASGAYLTVLLGQVNQLMLLCELEGIALLLNVGWLAAWATAGIWISAAGGVIAVSWFALGSSVAYSALAARLLAKQRAIRSFVQLPVPRLVA